MNGFDAVILDLDGTMVDSEPLSRAAWERLLARYGRVLADADYLAIVGSRNDVSTTYIQERYRLPLSLPELTVELEQLWAEEWQEGLPARPGLEPLLSALAIRAMPWGVATASPRDYAETVLRQLGHWGACQALVGGDEVEISKPNPEIYLLAAARLGVAPGRCLVVEDSVPGAQAGLNAGMTVVAIPSIYTDLRTLPAVHHRLASLADVPALLG